MCFNEKCCFCIPVEIGSLILGVITSITNALGFLACIGGLVYVNVFMGQEHYGECVAGICADVSYESSSQSDRTLLIASNSGLAVGLFVFLMDFGFSVALAEGASNKKAGHLKTYFIYGVVKSSLSMAGDIVLLVIITPLGIMGLFLLGIHSLLLVMVYQTYKKFLNGYGYGYGGIVVSREVDRMQLV